MEQRDNSTSPLDVVTVTPETMCTVLCISSPEKNSTRQNKRKLIKNCCSARNNDHCSKLMSEIFNFTVDSSFVLFCIC